MKPLNSPPLSGSTAQLAAATVEQPALLDPVIRATVNRQSILQTSAAFLGVDPKHVYNVLRGIWGTTKGQPALTDAEIWRGLALISRYELDPFAREIYVTRDKQGRLMIILGIDGWIRVLNRTDHYDGFEQELEEQDGRILSVTTSIYSTKRSHATSYKAFASEYVKLGGFMAEKIPGHMLRLFSLRHAARLFTPLGGCVTEEEARWIGGGAEDSSPPVSSLDDLVDREESNPEPESADVIAAPIIEPMRAIYKEDGVPRDAHKRAARRDSELAAMAESPHPELVDQYAQALGECYAGGVDALWEQVLVHVAAGRLTEADKAALAELANAAKTRLDKGAKKR